MKAPSLRESPPLRKWTIYRAAAACQILLFTIAVVVAGCSSDGEAKKKQASAAHQMGLANLRQGSATKAIQELAKAEGYDPENPEIQNSLGMAYWARREPALAEQKFLRAVALKPEYSEGWNNLGAFYIDMERYEEAVNALNSALRNVQYTTYERALANLGWAHYKLGRLKEAERRLQEAVEMAPGFALAHRSLGIVLFDQGATDKALGHFDEAARLYPGDAETHLRRGMALLKLNDKAGARSAFETAWKLTPRSDLGKSAKTYLDLLQ